MTTTEVGTLTVSVQADPTTRMENTMLKAIVTAGVITLGVALAPPAQALTNVSDTQRAENLICAAIAADPTFSGMDSVAIQLLLAGLTADEAAQALALSISETCPQYTKLALSWARSRG